MLALVVVAPLKPDWFENVPVPIPGRTFAPVPSPNAAFDSLLCVRPAFLGATLA